MENPVQKMENAWSQYRQRVARERLDSRMPQIRENFLMRNQGEINQFNKFDGLYREALQTGNLPKSVEYGRELEKVIKSFENSIERGIKSFKTSPWVTLSEVEAYKKIADAWNHSLKTRLNGLGDRGVEFKDFEVAQRVAKDAAAKANSRAELIVQLLNSQAKSIHKRALKEFTESESKDPKEFVRIFDKVTSQVKKEIESVIDAF